MAKKPSTQAGESTTSADGLQDALSQALDSADQTLTQRMTTLTQVHQARLTQLQRSATRATQVSGANSTQAKDAQQAVDASQTMFARVALLSRAARITPPAVTAQGWAVYGSVCRYPDQPVAAYCVYLVDQQKTYQRQYGLSYTDSNGDFSITYAGDATAAPQLFVAVSNAQGQWVEALESFQPQTGVAQRIDIVLPQTDTPVGNPPADVRDSAIPPKEDSAS